MALISLKSGTLTPVCFDRHRWKAGSFFLNGAVVTILIDKMRQERQATVAEFGVYELREGTFSYRYDSASTFTQLANTINSSSALPREGMRYFDITQEGATVCLRSRSAEKAEFVINAEGIR